jgi:hypothetical protein
MPVLAKQLLKKASLMCSKMAVIALLNRDECSMMKARQINYRRHSIPCLPRVIQ